MRSQRVEMHLEPEILDRVDAWRSCQPDHPSRAEAIRRLIHAGLGVPGEISITGGERLLLMMLCDLMSRGSYEYRKGDGGVDPEFIREALGWGHQWALDEEYELSSPAKAPRIVSEVREVLRMWDLIEIYYEKLSSQDKQRIRSEVEAFGKNVSFPGFSANEEGDYLSTARFIIENLGNYGRFKGRDLNSHFPTVGGYRRMLGKFRTMQDSLQRGKLSASHIIALLKLRTF